MPCRLIGAQPLDHLRRARAAIDQVADEDEQGLARRAALKLGVDLGEQILEQIEPAVDVADGIGAIALGAAGRVRVEGTNIRSSDSAAEPRQARQGHQDRRGLPIPR